MRGRTRRRLAVTAAAVAAGLIVTGCAASGSTGGTPGTAGSPGVVQTFPMGGGSKAGGLSMGTGGQMYMNLGGGLAMDMTSGGLGMNVGGGLVIPLTD